MQLRPQQRQKQTLKFQLNPKLIQRFKIFQSAYSDLLDKINVEADANVFIEIKQDDSLLKGVQATGKTQHQSPDNSDLISLKVARNEHQNLESYLLSQLPYLSLKPVQIPICEALIDGLDSIGYFPDYKTTRSSIVKSQSVTTKQVDVCLEILQHCEPEGVGARSLSECLMLQLKHHDFENKELILLLERVITDHLDDLAEKNFDRIAQACSIPVAGVPPLAEFIKHNLNPKPGSIFFREDDIPLIIPSFDITLDDTNTLKINNLEQSYGIQIGLSEHYLNLLNSPSTDKKTKDFLKEKFNKARDLQESIALRQEYTKSNLNFCLKHDHNNTHLKNKKIDIEKKLKSNQPTIPSTLADEIKTNIFLRCNDPEIKHGLGLKDSSDFEVFSKLRDLKDSF